MAGGCLDSRNGYISCAFCDLESATQLQTVRDGCESRDDSYHQYDWVAECPAGAVIGCRLNSTGNFKGELTQWYYAGAKCSSSETEVHQ